MLRWLSAGLLVTLTVVALVLAAFTGSTRLLMLAGIFWALSGTVILVLRWLEPALDRLPQSLASVGLPSAAGGWSSVESLIARGHYEAADRALLERAADPGSRAEATLRRATLLAGPLRSPEMAAVELLALRDAMTLDRRTTRRVGLQLTELYEGPLADRGRAIVELGRLLEGEEDPRMRETLRRNLASLKQAHFGGDA